MTMKRLAAYLLASTSIISFALSSAHGNPLDPNVVAGDASIVGVGTAVVMINQTSDKVIIDWRKFDIGVDETTTFLQPGSQSITLNRVTGSDGASYILGKLNANGQIFLINPDGILFGDGAEVDVGGLVATTHDILNADFLSGDYSFSQPGSDDASVVNLGTITVEEGGFAALVAPGVRNAGTIRANLGKIGLASADSFALDFYGDQLLQLAIGDTTSGSVIDLQTGQTLKDLVSNSGLLSAHGGTVQLTASAARAVVNSVINNTGNIEADSIGSRNGKIILGASTSDAKPAELQVQRVKVSGKLSATGDNAGETGGTIQITGELIELTVATIDAFGWSGGGKVLIGGDYMGGNGDPTTVAEYDIALEPTPIPRASYLVADESTVISADALSNGDGGKIILWSDEATLTAATLIARGGAEAGDGGFIETSGKYLEVRKAADASAAKGEAGTWLLDPLNVHLKAGVANNWTSYAATIFSDIDVGGVHYNTVSGTMFEPNGTGSYIDTNVLEAALNAGNNVYVTTRGTTGSEQGDIFVESDIRRTSGSGTRFLTLDAADDIIFSSGIDLVSTTGKMNIFLWAHDGEISAPSVGLIDTNGGVFKMDVRDGAVFKSTFNMPEIFGLEIFALNGAPRRDIDIRFDSDIIKFYYQNGVARVPSNGIQLVDSSDGYFELIAHNMDWVFYDRAIRVASHKPIPGVQLDFGFNYGADPSADLNGVAEVIWENPFGFPIADEPPSGQAVPVLEVSTDGDGNVDEYAPTSPNGIRLLAQFLAGSNASVLPTPTPTGQVLGSWTTANSTPALPSGIPDYTNPDYQSPSVVIQQPKVAPDQLSSPDADQIIRTANLGPRERRQGVDDTFVELLDALNLNTTFKITDASYSPGSGSSGGAGGAGFIYPDGIDYDLRGECVALVVALTQLDYPTTTWNRGSNALDGLLKPGDPVATFNSAGNYDSVHTAVFVSYIYSSTGKITGMYMIDQYNTDTFGSKAAGIRNYVFGDVQYFLVRQ